MSLQYINETLLKNRRRVCCGNMVELVDEPPAGRKFMEKFLGGPGPYKIKRIGRWPCGRTMLFFDMPGREPGAHASDFQ